MKAACFYISGVGLGFGWGVFAADGAGTGWPLDYAIVAAFLLALAAGAAVLVAGR